MGIINPLQEYQKNFKMAPSDLFVIVRDARNSLEKADSNGDWDDDVSYYTDCLKETIQDLVSYLEDIKVATKELNDALWEKEFQRKNVKQAFDQRPYVQSDFV